MSANRSSLGIVALVVHARRVPSEVRERFAADADAVAHDHRVILLRTCHRVELYAAAGRPDGEAADAPALLLPDLPAGGVRLTDHDATRHLFAVASGLDSVVLGEDEILHQLRDCLAARQLTDLATSAVASSSDRRRSLAKAEPGQLQPVLDRMFQLALHVGRQSRAWREGPPRSLADVALDRIEAAVGDLAGRRTLIVGAGQMSRLTALAAARRRAIVIVTNRSPRRAAALAADVAGTTVPFHSVPDGLAAVLASLAGPWELEPDAKRSLLEGAAPVVDLSSPPAVGRAMRDRLGSRFVSVDDIAHEPGEALGERVRRRIERLIAEADAELTQWIGARAAVPTIQALTERAELRRAAEMDLLLRRLPHLADHERDLVEQMSHRLVAGLLHAPLSSLRDDQGGEHERAARDLFSL